VGECVPGSQTCTAGAWGACEDKVGPVDEECNGADDDCDDSTDESMPDLSCGMGACMVTVPACAGGVPGTCTPGTPGTETCDGTDEDCNGMVDDGLGTLSCGVGACAATAPACVGGAPGTCTPGTPGTETCDGTDEDCNGMVDDGLGTISCGVGACMRTVPACSGGVPGTCTPGPMSTETCDGTDEDCDGMVDEGNPGGGAVCGGAAVGGCRSQTTCVGGALVCRGTFVGPPGVGSPTNPGTRGAPLSTIGAAQTNAVAIGGGADVCVCDTGAAGASRYDENVTMIEDVSVLGSYDCGSWTRPGGRTTTIGDTDLDGVDIGAAITDATTLGFLTVDGLDSASGGARSTAISITGGSPRIDTVVVTGGSATESVGVSCDACGATLVGVSSSAGFVTSLGIGLHVTGASGTLTVTGGSFGGGSSTADSAVTHGVRLEMCTGAPTFTGTNTFGGGGGMPFGTRAGLESSGAMCAPVIDGGAHEGCEASGEVCTGIACIADSRCVVRNSRSVRGTFAPVAEAYGLRCLAGGCATITFNNILPGSVTATGRAGIGLEIDGSSPVVDDNQITGPGGSGALAATTRLFAVYLRSIGAVLTNNVIRDGASMRAVDVVRLHHIALGPVGAMPVLHSNTIQYNSCTACGPRVGLGIVGIPGALSGPQGIVRNNVIEHGGIGGTTRPVVERDIAADLFAFENNDLYDPTAGPLVYVDEGTTPLTIVQVNALGGAAANIDVDCQLNATWHIPNSSMCVDAGTAAGAPDHDFDPNRRPLVLGYDIGADEYAP
jgi:hypothetical protein